MKTTVKRSLALVITLMTFVVGFVALACSDPEQSAPPSFAEYYSDGAAGEYGLSLGSNGRFVLKLGTESKSGSVVYSGSTVTFDFDVDADGAASASMTADGPVIVYNSETLRFYRKVDYKVSFDGAAIEPITIRNGRALGDGMPADPTESGKVFVGWYEDQAYTRTFDEYTLVKGNITLYARWVNASEMLAQEYTVTFDAGSYAGSQSYESRQTIGGKLYGAPTPAIRDGYTFGGWYISAYDDAQKLTQKYKAETVLAEDITLYALWQQDGGDKLATPKVSASAAGVEWESVGIVSGYKLEITSSAAEFVAIDEEVQGGNKLGVFAEAPAGDYVIKLTAKSQRGEEYNSQTAVVYYRHKALGRVSHFDVENSVLSFNAVANAQKYILGIECGDINHRHSALEVSQNSYNFSSCDMREGGIKFTVRAAAEGYLNSLGREYVYGADLSAVAAESVTYDDATQTATWVAVQNATGYVISAECGTAGHDHSAVVVGNVTSYSFKNCSAKADGNIKISVTPLAKGYNSPAATERVFQKSSLAAPSNIRIIGTMLSWDRVAGAEKYKIVVGGVEREVAASDTVAPSYDLRQLRNEITWANSDDYKLKVGAVKAGANEQAVFADELDIRYYKMHESLTYDNNVVSWRHVIGASKYQVKVNDNDADIITVADGKNYATVAMTKKGTNTIYVRFYDPRIGSGADVGAYSQWVSLEVEAYEVTLHNNYTIGEAQEQVRSAYLATGDKIAFQSPTRTGYNFGGWYDAAGGIGSKYTSSTYTAQADSHLYAYWNGKSYTVTFNYGKGSAPSGAPSSVTVKYEEEFPNWHTAVAPSGSDFGGWYSLPDGRGTKYTDNRGNCTSVYNTPADLTVYANYWSNALIYKYSSVSNYYQIQQDYSKIQGVTSITIPATYDDGVNGDAPVGIIDVDAFKNNTTIEEIKIPNSISYISTYISSSTDLVAYSAFAGCTNLKNIEIYEVEGVRGAEYFSEDGVLYRNGQVGLELCAVPQGKTGAYVVKDGTVTIPSRALYYTKISAFIIPASVTTIGKLAMTYANGLKRVEFLSPIDGEDNSELTIGEQVFANAANLESVKLPARTMKFKKTGDAFDAEIFMGCDSISKIEVHDSNTVYATQDGILYNKAKDTLVYFPMGKSVVLDNKGVPQVDKDGKIIAGTFTIPTGVRVIGQRAFLRCKYLSEVKIPFWVETISNNAFELVANATYSALTRITFLPAEIEGADRPLTIGENAFMNVKMTSITIPSRVTSIGANAFYNCTELAEIIFETGTGSAQPLSIGDSAFNSCTKLKVLNIPARADSLDLGMFTGSKISSITVDPANANYAAIDGVLYDKEQTQILFYPYGRTGMYIVPETVTQIGGGVFAGRNNLTEITISSRITNIGTAAFDGCGELVAVYFAENAEQEVPATGDGAAEPAQPVELVIGMAAFRDCSKLKIIELPTRVRTLNHFVFYGTKSLTNKAADGSKFAMPGVTEIKYQVFYNSGIAMIEFSEGLTKIYTSAFAGSKLEQAVLPATLRQIDYQAFNNCSELARVEFKEDLAVNNRLDFTGTWLSVNVSTYAESIMTPAEGVQIFASCPKLSTVILPTRLTNIPAYTFSMSGLTQISIPATVTRIGTNAFGNCTTLDTINFLNDDSLTDADSNPLTLVLDDMYSSKKIGSSSMGVFYKCTALSNVTLPARLSRIGYYAFNECTALKTITLPSGLKDTMSPTDATKVADPAVGNGAFYNCSALKTVRFTSGTNRVSVGQSVFWNCKALDTLQLPANLAQDGLTTDWFNGIGQINNLSIDKKPDGTDSDTFSVDSQGILYNADKSVLYWCPAGVGGAITIPNTVTLIKNKAFYNDIKITAVTFEAGGTSDLCIGDPKINDDGTIAEMKSGTSVVWCQVFANTKIKSIEIPARTKFIGAWSFSSGIYSTITFEADSRLELIGESVFRSLSALKSIRIPASVKTIGAECFMNDYNLATVTFEANSVLSSIGKSAFSSTKLQSIVVPDSVTSLGDAVFDKCVMTNVTLPSGLITVGNAFSGSAIGSVSISDSSTNFKAVDGVLFSKDGTKLYYYPAGKTDTSYIVPSSVTSIGEKAFANHRYIINVTIPNTVTEIGASAFTGSVLEQVEFVTGGTNNLVFKGSVFEKCANLISVTLPARLSDISTNAFYGCKSLESVVFSEGIRLQELGAWSFRDCTELKSISLPDGIRKIGMWCFGGCINLSSITLNDDLGTGVASGVFGVSVFYDCKSLVSIEIPANITKLDATNLFYGCSSLSDITFKGSITAIGDSVFEGCTSLTAFTIPSTVTTIGNKAFKGSGLVSITIPRGITKLGAQASASTISYGVFENCTSLTSVIFEEGFNPTTFGIQAFKGCTSLTSDNITWASSMTKLGVSMFEGCTSFTEFTFPDTVQTKVQGVFKNCTNLSQVTFSSITAKNNGIGKEMFMGCTSLTSITLPTFAASSGIEDSAFSGTGLTSLAIPATIKSIGAKAFLGCADLVSVTWTPQSSYTSGVTIGAQAFEGCTLLDSFVIPTRVLAVNSYLFKDCVNLTAVTIPTGITTFIGTNPTGNPFEGCPIVTVTFAGNAKFVLSNGAIYSADKKKLLSYVGGNQTEFIVPNTVTEIGTAAFAGSKLQKIVLQNGLTTISAYAFRNCTQLAEINIPGSVASISYNVFYGCTSLEEIVLPSSLTSIGSNTFENSGLKRIVLPDTLTSLPAALFKGCASLVEVNIPESAITIGANIFEGCVSLVSIDLKNVSEIPGSAFSGCISLSQIVFPERFYSATNKTFLDLGGSAFAGCTSLVSIAIPTGVTRIGSSAFEGCTSLKTVRIPEGVDILYSNAFKGCSALTSINLPAAVTSIRGSVFAGCTSLKSIVISAAVTDIDANAFSGWGADQTITMDGISAPMTTWEDGWDKDCNAVIVWAREEEEA